nr:uncharacterized protein LOC109191529 [Ipomoea batatas]
MRDVNIRRRFCSGQFQAENSSFPVTESKRRRGLTVIDLDLESFGVSDLERERERGATGLGGEAVTPGEPGDGELHIRSLPTRITKNVVRLNPAQQQCVREMGMGNILDLNITNIPRRLGLWLVENFDPRSCTLQLQNGQSIHITAADVAATLGLPMGQIEITKRAARAVPEILQEWRAIFEKTTCITPVAMITRMLETDAGDPWFKRHFALLVITVLIDPMQDFLAEKRRQDLWRANCIPDDVLCQEATQPSDLGHSSCCQ